MRPEELQKILRKSILSILDTGLFNQELTEEGADAKKIERLRGDMLDVASMGLHVGQLSSRADMAWCFEAVTNNSAKIMGLEGYGLDVGCEANMNLLQATDPIEAVRLRATRLSVIRSGKVIAETPAAVAALNINGRPTVVDPANH